MRFPSLQATLIVTLAANLSLLVLAGCGHQPASPPAPSSPMASPIHPAAVAAVPQDAFLGNAACAGCHQAEFMSHRHSRHAQTLKEMSRKELGRLSPPAGRIAGTGILVTTKGDRFGIGLPARSDFILPLEYALGSGKSGMTYVSVIEGGKVAEMAMSYFPHLKQWHVTPGDEDLPTDSLGRIRPPLEARTCFSCHAVMPSAQTLVPAQRFFGVGCESCHGAGGDHVRLMRAGKYHQDKMENLRSWSAARLVKLCAQCHGSAQSAMNSATPVSTEGTNRFQPFGLAQSQCFKHSNGALSCITCHSPHTDVSTNQKAYEEVCLNCHTTASSHRPPALRSARVKLCPVNPQDKCINCHMPTSQVIDKTTQTRMADHFIRVHA